MYFEIASSCFNIFHFSGRKRKTAPSNQSEGGASSKKRRRGKREEEETFGAKLDEVQQKNNQLKEVHEQLTSDLIVKNAVVQEQEGILRLNPHAPALKRACEKAQCIRLERSQAPPRNFKPKLA